MICESFEQSTCRGVFEASASHGDALNEVFSSIVHIPLHELDNS